jgi:hypothetical protein
MQQGGSQYRRLAGAFQRIFGATIFFGTDSQAAAAISTRVLARSGLTASSRATRILHRRAPTGSSLSPIPV